MKIQMIRTYSELRKLKSFEERFQYIKLSGFVGVDTFGFDRIFNQRFYHSYEWKRIRNQIIIRDNGCDLGIPGYDISGTILIHHMNPISIDDIQNASEYLLNPEYLICVSHETHNAIHYGNDDILQKHKFIERKPNDTCSWKH